MQAACWGRKPEALQIAPDRDPVGGRLGRDSIGEAESLRLPGTISTANNPEQPEKPRFPEQPTPPSDMTAGDHMGVFPRVS